MDCQRNNSTFYSWHSQLRQYSQTPKMNRTQQHSTSVHFYRNSSQHFYKSQSLSSQRSLEKLFFLLQNPKSQEKLHFDHYDPEVIDHDVQLKKYILGQKSFNNYHHQPITHFEDSIQSKNNFNEFQPKKIIPNQIQTHYIANAKNNKQKFKSTTNLKFHVNQPKNFRKTHITVHKKNQILAIKKENPELLTKPIEQTLYKKIKPLKYLDVKNYSQNNTQPLDIKRILKKVNQKRQADLMDMLKKLNLTKVKTIGDLNQQRLSENSSKEKGLFKILQRRCRKSQQKILSNQNLPSEKSLQHSSQLPQQKQQCKPLESKKPQRQLVVRKMRRLRKSREEDNQRLQHLKQQQQRMGKSLSMGFRQESGYGQYLPQGGMMFLTVVNQEENILPQQISF